MSVVLISCSMFFFIITDDDLYYKSKKNTVMFVFHRFCFSCSRFIIFSPSQIALFAQ